MINDLWFKGGTVKHPPAYSPVFNQNGTRARIRTLAKRFKVVCANCYTTRVEKCLQMLNIEYRANVTLQENNRQIENQIRVSEGVPSDAKIAVVCGPGPTYLVLEKPDKSLVCFDARGTKCEPPRADIFIVARYLLR